MSVYEIRKCCKDDLDIVTDMYDNLIYYMDCTNTNYPKWTYKQYPARQSIAAAISSGSQYACFADGKICGAFVLNNDPQGAYGKANWGIALSDGEYAVIHSLGVARDMYGKGIGTRMIQYCIETAKAEGCQAVRVDVVPTNIPARHLYEKNGFVFIAETDLERGITEIPLFDLFEYIICG